MNRRTAVIGAGIAVASLAALLRPALFPERFAPAVTTLSVAAAPANPGQRRFAPVAIAGDGGTDAASATAADRGVTSADQGATVDVEGAVHRPGVYALAPGARLVAAVRAAGGLVAGADGLAIDLARRARDGEQIVVPRSDDVVLARRVLARERAAVTRPEDAGASGPADTGASGTDASVAGTADAGGIAAPQDDPTATPRRRRRSRKHRHKRRHHRVPAADTTSVDGPPADAAAPDDASAGAANGGLTGAQPVAAIDINTADAATLATLPGIGDGLAERIVRFREESGPFARPEELLDVNGMTDSRYEAIAGSITVAGP